MDESTSGRLHVGCVGMWPQGFYTWWEFTLVGIFVFIPVIVLAASDIGRTAFLALLGSVLFLIGFPLALIRFLPLPSTSLPFPSLPRPSSLGVAGAARCGSG